MKKEKHNCERCGEVLNEDRIVWLELSITDGRYYNDFPTDHKSQGGFAFGSACAKRVLNDGGRILKHLVSR